MSKKVTARDLFLAVLAVLLLSVSFYQTWLGLQQIFGPASFVIALVLSLLLLFLLWIIRNAKMNGKPTSSLVGIYIFIASFCFIANFNALYTRFMRTDIYTTELRNINKHFNNLETEVQSKLHYQYGKDTTRLIVGLKDQMMEQIIDLGNPRIGPKTRALIREIEKYIKPVKVDELTAVGDDYADLATRMGKQIDNIIFVLPPEETALKSDINNAVLKWNKRIQDLLLRSNKEKDAISQGLIDESLTEYNKLGKRAQAVLGDNKFKFDPVLSSTQEVGKIGFAFNHAIKNFGWYQLVVLLGCILLDFVIVIIIILVTNSDNDTPNKGSVFAVKKGKTLIPKN